MSIGYGRRQTLRDQVIATALGSWKAALTRFLVPRTLWVTVGPAQLAEWEHDSGSITESSETRRPT